MMRGKRLAVVLPASRDAGAPHKRVSRRVAERKTAQELVLQNPEPPCQFGYLYLSPRRDVVKKDPDPSTPWWK